MIPHDAGSPLVGTNFWTWGGEGRAQHPDHVWRPGDSFLGDPASGASRALILSLCGHDDGTDHPRACVQNDAAWRERFVVCRPRAVDPGESPKNHTYNHQARGASMRGSILLLAVFLAAVLRQAGAQVQGEQDHCRCFRAEDQDQQEHLRAFLRTSWPLYLRRVLGGREIPHP